MNKKKPGYLRVRSIGGIKVSKLSIQHVALHNVYTCKQIQIKNDHKHNLLLLSRKKTSHFIGAS